MSTRRCPEAITPSPATMMTTLDSECEQSQQDSPPLLCTVRLCIGAWEWCMGHGVHGKGRGQPSRVSLTSIVWARFFLSAVWARLPEPRVCRDSSMSLPISPWECSDYRCSQDKSWYPPSHLLSIISFAGTVKSIPLYGHSTYFFSTQTFKLFLHPSYWGWCRISLW